MASDDFFSARLDGMVDPRHPLAVLAHRMPWSEIEAALASALAHKDRSGLTVQGADLFGTSASVVSSGVSQPRQQGRRAGAALLPGAVQDQGRGRWRNDRRATTTSTAQVTPRCNSPAQLAAGTATACARRVGYRQSHRLQLEALAGADALHRQRRRADLQQLGGEPDPADRARAVELAVGRQPACGQAGALQS